jgi:adenylate cyclase
VANETRVEHRFTVIMCADVVGYSRLMGLDEEGTLAALQRVRRDLVDASIAEHKGRIVRAMGDGLLVEFGSVLDAVRCALAIQRAMPEHGATAPADRRIRLRIAINMGDVVTDGDLIHGDGVTIAARMESLAEPGGINVSRAVRDQVRDRLPIAFEDLGEHEVAHIVRPVRVFRVVSAAPPEAEAEAGAASRAVAAAAPAVLAAAASAPTKPAPEKPAVAVLPFQNLGGDADAEFFLDSVAEDLITELARARWFSVIARNTSFSYKHKGADAKQLARELGVRYVVEGSLRKAGSRVRVSCQLVDAASGQHLWADRFDGTLEDSFDLQDKITESAIGSVAPVLRLAEIERARRKPEAALDVYDLTLRALPACFAETAADNETALHLLDQALQQDPGYPTANALAAWCRQQRHLMNWPGTEPDDREEAKRFARLAIDGGADVPLALAVAGAVRAALTRDHDLALAAVDRAAMMNPNAAIVLGFDAVTRCLCGQYPRAIEHAERALHLSPLEPLVYQAAFAMALACLLTGRAEEAVAHARQAIAGNRYFAFPYCVLALGSARLGHAGEAAQAVQRLAQIAPNFHLGALRSIRFADAAQLQPDLDLLRAAHLPE